MIEGILLLGSTVFPIVEWIKSGLLQTTWFVSLNEQQQAWLLRLIAALLGIGGAILTSFNAFAVDPRFASAPVFIGFLLTGILSVVPAEGLHILFAWGGVKGNVTASKESKVMSQKAGGTISTTYAGFM